MNIEGINALREQLSREGWEVEQTYAEPIEHAWTAKRAGFVIMAIARPKGSIMFRDQKRAKDSTSLNMWGPDRLAVKIPEKFDDDALAATLRICLRCGAADVETHMAGFAGRYCADCLPFEKKRQEYPGWTR